MGTPANDAPDPAASGPDPRDPRPSIPVRRPATLLSREIPRHWYGGDPFATHFLNALSSTFPFGEAFFVRAVLRYRDRVADPELRRAISGFSGQEGQHSRLHQDHVDMLVEQGYPGIATRNRIVDRIVRWHNRHAPRVSLASTAALEHLTAILARRLLSDPERWTGDMHPEMARLWLWHALEEAEHKSVAFDVLREVAPAHGWRVVAQVLDSAGLAIEVLDRLAYLLYKDGLLWRWETWRGGWRFLFGRRGATCVGREGFLRGLGPGYRAWFRRDFHPDQIDDRALIESRGPSIGAAITG